MRLPYYKKHANDLEKILLKINYHENILDTAFDTATRKFALIQLLGNLLPSCTQVFTTFTFFQAYFL